MTATTSPFSAEGRTTTGPIKALDATESFNTTVAPEFVGPTAEVLQAAHICLEHIMTQEQKTPLDTYDEPDIALTKWIADALIDIVGVDAPTDEDPTLIEHVYGDFFDMVMTIHCIKGRYPVVASSVNGLHPRIIESLLTAQDLGYLNSSRS